MRPTRMQTIRSTGRVTSVGKFEESEFQHNWHNHNQLNISDLTMYYLTI